MIDQPAEQQQPETQPKIDPKKGAIRVTFTSPTQYLDAYVDHGIVIVPNEEGKHRIAFHTSKHAVRDLGEMLATFFMLLEQHPAGPMAMRYAQQMVQEADKRKPKIITLGNA